MREDRFHRIFRKTTAGYIAVSLGLTGMYALKKNWYLMAQSLGTIVALGAVLYVLHLLRIRPVYSYCTAIVLFLFGSYTLGVACELYQVTPGYDKLLHMLSGTFTMMLALPLFYFLKAGHRLERSDWPLAAAFCLTTALAVAGVWELCEYAFGLLTPLDPQCAQATGVADTMQDMLVCTLGALMALPSLNRLYRTGEGGLLFGGTEEFIRLNLAEEGNE